jgi:hypothetical protein
VDRPRARPSTSASSGSGDSPAESDSDSEAPGAENPRPNLSRRVTPLSAQGPLSHLRRPAQPSSSPSDVTGSAADGNTKTKTEALHVLAERKAGIEPGHMAQLSEENNSGANSMGTSPDRDSASDSDDDAHPPTRTVLGQVQNRMAQGGGDTHKGEKKKERERQGTVPDDADGKRSGNGYGVSNAAKGALAQLQAKRARLAGVDAGEDCHPAERNLCVSLCVCVCVCVSACARDTESGQEEEAERKSEREYLGRICHPVVLIRTESLARLPQTLERGSASRR